MKCAMPLRSFQSLCPPVVLRSLLFLQKREFRPQKYAKKRPKPSLNAQSLCCFIYFWSPGRPQCFGFRDAASLGLRAGSAEPEISARTSEPWILGVAAKGLIDQIVSVTCPHMQLRVCMYIYTCMHACMHGMYVCMYVCIYQCNVDVNPIVAEKCLSWVLHGKLLPLSIGN